MAIVCALGNKQGIAYFFDNGFACNGLFLHERQFLPYP